MAYPHICTDLPEHLIFADAMRQVTESFALQLLSKFSIDSDSCHNYLHTLYVFVVNICFV